MLEGEYVSCKRFFPASTPTFCALDTFTISGKKTVSMDFETECFLPQTIVFSRVGSFLVGKVAPGCLVPVFMPCCGGSPLPSDKVPPTRNGHFHFERSGLQKI